MLKNVGKLVVLSLVILAILFVSSCGDDGDSVAPETKGVIEIDPSPNSLNAPWTLSGPAGFSKSDVGDRRLTKLDSGDYSIIWGDVGGWTSPGGETKNLPAGSTVEFSGEYGPKPGTILVDVEPDSINAPWAISGPSGYLLNGSGDQSLAEMSSGEYAVTWGDVAGWAAPNDTTFTLENDGVLTIGGLYISRTGAIIINPQPNQLGASWSISGPEGYSIAGSGYRVIQDGVPGLYEITWGPIEDWDTPEIESKRLYAGASLEFLGEYAYSFGTVVVDINPDGLDTSWEIRDPRGGILYRGSEDTALARMVPGRYWISWNGTPYWGPRQSGEAQTLAKGDTIFFSGDFELRPSSISIAARPSGLGATWSVSGPGGFYQSGSEDTSIGNVQPGEYTIEWGDVSGRVTPIAESFEIVPGAYSN